MYEYIRGILAEKNVADVVIEAGGIGYLLTIPLSTFDKMPAPGSEVRLYTHHHVREDAERLFGFYSKHEREVFQQLIAISSIGPKIAMNVLSGLSIEDLYRAVQNGNVSSIKAISGIGAKTAERLIIELKGKLPPVPLVAPAAAGQSAESKKARSTAVSSDNDPRHQAFLALLALGYIDKQVVASLNRVEATLVDSSATPVEIWIKKALQVI